MKRGQLLTRRNRLEDLQEEQDSDHCPWICQRYGPAKHPITYSKADYMIAPIRSSWPSHRLALPHRHRKGSPHPRSMHNRLLRRIRIPRLHQRLAEGVPTNQDRLPARISSSGHSWRSLPLPRRDSKGTTREILRAQRRCLLLVPVE
jgi:hypothetical protein